MSAFGILDVDNVARIILMYLDGDIFEEVLLDKLGHTDYHFANFNSIRKTLLKMEKINPELKLYAVAWQQRIDNEDAVVPLVVGSAAPIEGHLRRKVNPVMKSVFETGEKQVLKRTDVWYPPYHPLMGCSVVHSHYYPIKNSDAEIVGILEIMRGE